jgi:hypothetical protein
LQVRQGLREKAASLRRELRRAGLSQQISERVRALGEVGVETGPLQGLADFIQSIIRPIVTEGIRRRENPGQWVIGVRRLEPLNQILPRFPGLRVGQRGIEHDRAMREPRERLIEELSILRRSEQRQEGCGRLIVPGEKRLRATHRALDLRVGDYPGRIANRFGRRNLTRRPVHGGASFGNGRNRRVETGCRSGAFH